jgi:hypothetical protein
MNANTVSRNPTHFLRGVELIENGRQQYNVSSENWPYPTRYNLGSPCERYYAEIWVDGMDWQPSYWIIEEVNLENPKVYPLLIFYENRDREIFNDYDFEMLVTGCMWYRRDKFWVKHNNLGMFTDIVWPYLYLLETDYSAHFHMVKAYFEHASQPRVPFFINMNFIPEEFRKVKSTSNSGGKL